MQMQQASSLPSLLIGDDARARASVSASAVPTASGLDAKRVASTPALSPRKELPTKKKFYRSERAKSLTYSGTHLLTRDPGQGRTFPATYSRCTCFHVAHSASPLRLAMSLMGAQDDSSKRSELLSSSRGFPSSHKEGDSPSLASDRSATQHEKKRHSFLPHSRKCNSQNPSEKYAKTTLFQVQLFPKETIIADG